MRIRYKKKSLFGQGRNGSRFRCDNVPCPQVFSRTPSYLKYDHQFCSRNCFNEYQRKLNAALQQTKD